VIASSLLRNQSRTIESMLTSLGFLVTIILGDDSLNETFFPLKEQDARYLFFFFNREIIFNWSPRCPGVTTTTITQNIYIKVQKYSQMLILCFVSCNTKDVIALYII